MCRTFLLAFLVATTAGCSEHEAGQISEGDNKIGPATTKAVNDRAVEVPAVRNTMETTPDPSAGELNQSAR